MFFIGLGLFMVLDAIWKALVMPFRVVQGALGRFADPILSIRPGEFMLLVISLCVIGSKLIDYSIHAIRNVYIETFMSKNYAPVPLDMTKAVGSDLVFTNSMKMTNPSAMINHVMTFHVTNNSPYPIRKMRFSCTIYEQDGEPSKFTSDYVTTRPMYMGDKITFAQPFEASAFGGYNSRCEIYKIETVYTYWRGIPRSVMRPQPERPEDAPPTLIHPLPIYLDSNLNVTNDPNAGGGYQDKPTTSDDYWKDYNTGR